MKKILKVITLFYLTLASCQNSKDQVKLEMNLEKGMKYKTSMVMKQNMQGPQAMLMNMTMDMVSEVKDIQNELYDIETKFDLVKVDINQGGQQMSYDSSKKEEELDDMGKILATQFKPILGMIVSTKVNKSGAVSDVKIEPSIPGAESITQNQASINYPEKVLKIGDSWTEEKSNNGVSMKVTYTLKSIDSNKATLDLKGELPGEMKGTFTGETQVDLKTGLPSKSDMKMKMNTMDVDMNIDIAVKITLV